MLYIRCTSDNKFIYSSMNIQIVIMLLTFIGEYCTDNNSFESLKQLDEELTDFYTFPDKYSNWGNHLLSKLTKINDTIKLFINVIEGKSKMINILKEAKDLRVQGGPLFLKVKMTQNKTNAIQSSCNWKSKYVEHMFLRRLDVKNTWRRFYKLYKKNKLWLEKCFIDSGVHVNVNISYHLRLKQKNQTLLS